jgi:hypothetical protein
MEACARQIPGYKPLIGWQHTPPKRWSWKLNLISGLDFSTTFKIFTASAVT